jgi:hypothetical protein
LILYTPLGEFDAGGSLAQWRSTGNSYWAQMTAVSCVLVRVQAASGLPRRRYRLCSLRTSKISIWPATAYSMPLASGLSSGRWRCAQKRTCGVERLAFFPLISSRSATTAPETRSAFREMAATACSSGMRSAARPRTSLTRWPSSGPDGSQHAPGPLNQLRPPSVTGVRHQAGQHRCWLACDPTTDPRHRPAS